MPRELDLVVEGDAVAVARAAAGRVGGTLTAHERFGTATVRTGDFAFDLAGARARDLRRGRARCPTVELGATLEEDLARRDFTVNAMAVSLADGRLTAWPGAREDLDDGVLRVLHDRSFADDPTRMLRLVRYAARLGFSVDPHTEALIDPALLETVTGDRAGNELRLLLREPPRGARAAGPLRAGTRPCSASASRSTGSPNAPGRAARPRGEQHRRRPPSARRPPEPPRFRTPGPRGDRGRGGRLERLHGHLDGSDADVWRLLRGERVETVQLLAAAGDEGARRWLDRIRHRKLSISGDDLIAGGLAGARGGGGPGRARWRAARRPRAGPREPSWPPRRPALVTRVSACSHAADDPDAAASCDAPHARIGVLHPRTAACRAGRSTRSTSGC